MIALPQLARNLFSTLGLAGILLSGVACFADDVVPNFARKKPPKLAPTFTFDLQLPKGEKVARFTITAKMPKSVGNGPFHIFSMKSGPNLNKGNATKVSFDSDSAWEPADAEFKANREAHRVEKPKEPGGDEGAQFAEEYEGTVIWTRQVRLKADASEAAAQLKGLLKYQLCDARSCRIGSQTFNITAKTVDRLAEANPKAESEIPPVLPDELNAAAGDQVAAVEVAESTVPDAKVVRAGGVGGINKAGGLPWFLLTAVLAGFAALLTPCVFPMVPITISFFNKQAEKEHHRPITMASVYCLGIIGTFTILGVVMSALCGAASLNQLATGAWMNIFLSIVLGFFGLSLLGMYEIRMPSWLLTATSGQQGRGGYLGVLFMALTFTLTSFTCTFAFAGGLLVAAAQGDRLWPVLGLLAFSAAFSLPFFFLALFPSLLQKLPRSGGWMNVVKVVMGMVEIGAAFKFLSVADVAWNGVPTLFDYELVLASWMVISLMTGAYLLGLYRLPHDIEASSIGVPRLLGAMSFVGLAVYISIGLFSSHKPSGALWENIVAFAPQKIDHSAVEDGPRPEGPFLVHGGLSYSLDVQKAVEFAVKANRPLFVEFTGQTCTNCRRMEIGAMNRPDAKDRLSKFVRVQLYTDSVPEVADKKEAKRLADLNRKLQQEWFGDTTLPAYGIVTAKPQVLKDPNAFLNDFYGMEQSRGEFTNFLEVGLNRWKEIQTRKVKEVTASKDSQTRAQLSSAANQPEKNVVDNR